MDPNSIRNIHADCTQLAVSFCNQEKRNLYCKHSSDVHFASYIHEPLCVGYKSSMISEFLLSAYDEVMCLNVQDQQLVSKFGVDYSNTVTLSMFE